MYLGQCQCLLVAVAKRVVQGLDGVHHAVGLTQVARFLIYRQFRFQMVLYVTVADGVGVGLPVPLFLLQASQGLVVFDDSYRYGMVSSPASGVLA